MPVLLSAHDLGKSFGPRRLFAGLTFAVEPGDRIGLIGPNGAGKSTLLGVLAGALAPDAGTLAAARGLRVGFLPQIPSFDPAATVRGAVLSAAVAARDERKEHEEDWETEARVDELLARLSILGGSGPGDGVRAETPVETLSGGLKKRLALARELAKRPELLLLDEPTNHLDVESILWLEGLLASAPFATITVTHDRLFLQRVANRILELDRRHAAGLLSVAGDYATYVETKAALLAAQERRETALANTLRRETEWLKRGAKARTTKQEARIQRAEALADEVSDLAARNRSRSVRLGFEAKEGGPKRLVEAKGISKALGGRTLFSSLDLLLTPKSRLGLLGPNGCGKSTLIRVLVGELAPDDGSVKRADGLSVAYFEQGRDALDPALSVVKTLAPEGDQVIYRGRALHVRSYLDRFLFTKEQAEMPAGALSGGEQSRLAMARLMLRPASLLVLDEPTNDLDFATLNVLEECLAEFGGAVLLVTHDRYFLDQVATEILAFSRDARGRPALTSFADLAQWEAWRAEETARSRAVARGGEVSADTARAASRATSLAASLAVSPATSSTPSPEARGRKRRLGYLERRELDGIEAAIEEAEARHRALVAETERPENLSDGPKLVALARQIEEAEAEVARLYGRWAELSGLAAEG